MQFDNNSINSKQEPKKQYNNSPLQTRLPLLLSITLVAGILLGATFFGSSSSVDPATKSFLKIREVLSYVSREYVDTVDLADLTDYGLAQMIERLDPHSVYYPAKEVALAKMPLEGDFDGIGVEFMIMKDTIQVVSAIAGGPSEAVGVMSGDKIVAVDGANVAGIGVTNRDVFSKLRGPKGSKVKVSILRGSAKSKPVDFTIVRDKIPTHSVDVAYMIDGSTGYVKISRFAQNTAQEVRDALTKLRKQGMKKLIVDVRDNPGGYMEQANQIANEFLASGQMIVYTKSKEGRFDQENKATSAGDFEKGGLMVLINEGSASASEILAGAIQDNDRGLVVGRRSFGKGLVQMPISLSDGSELRLTISRYYTPSGRSIQKPYKMGDKDYEMDFENRFEHGELFNKDSIKFNEQLKYKTLRGRTVYGGGGIMPDVFVPFDTSYASKYYAGLFNKNIIRQYSLNYANANKNNLKQMGLPNFRKNWKVSEAMIEEIKELATREGLPFDAAGYKRSEKTIKNAVKAFIGRSVWREEGFYSIIMEDDEVLQKALGLWPDALALEKKKK